MPDVVIIGGGVIGLSIAWELTGYGLSVRVLERSGFGQEASWAGAGMLPPGNLTRAKTSEARLRGAAHQLWPKWSEELTSFSGLDNQFIRCGGLEICFDASDAEYQSGLAALRSEDVAIGTNDLTEIRKSFSQIGEDVAAGYTLPEFCQVRNPRHVKTLQVACAMRGVELVAGSPVHHIEVDGERIVAVQAGAERHQAGEFIVAGGAWSGHLLGQVGIRVAIEPLKGQIVLLKCMPLPFRSVIQAGREYLVPRLDGRILIGSTEENVGFDKRSTAEAVSNLIQFAQRVVPGLRQAEVERSWAGLRPYSGTGRPYIGRLPQFRNGSVAAGHFRYGLHLSPITAVLMRQVLLGQNPDLPEDCQIGQS